MRRLILLIGLSLAAEEIYSQHLNEKFINLLKPLRDINIRLRNREDAYENSVQVVLRQSVCSKNIFWKSKPGLHYTKNNILLTNITDLNAVLSIYSSRAGTQFYIIDGAYDLNALTDMSRNIWNRWGIYRNYYVISLDDVYFYNPFALTGLRQYGKLQRATAETDFLDIFQDLNGYPIKTYIFRSVYANLVYDKNKNILLAAGADAMVAYTIQKVMNCTLVLQEPDEEFFGHRLDNGSFDGAIGRTIRYDSELTLTGFFVKDYLTRDVEFSVTVYMDKLCCYVSKAKRVPQSILPLFSVKTDMWLGFICSAFLWAFIWSLIRKFNLYFIHKKSDKVPEQLTRSCQYIRILIDTWVIWVRVNVSRYPPFLSEKIFVISLCLVSVIFGAIFESSLATVYINPLYYKDINTLQELDESNFKILIKHAAMKDDLFFGSDSLVFKRLDNKLLYVHEMEDRVIEMMSRRGGFASVTRASSLILDDISYILSKKIHQISECPKNYHIAYILPRDSPYRKRVNSLLLRFLNAGLVNYWIEMMYHKARLGILQSPEILKVMGNNLWKILTIEDLQLAFYVIILGSILATVVLLAEIFVVLWYKRNRRRNKENI